ncbi:hypothetical protein ACWOFR_15090 [Carnobacterium gallinarum]|uniref:hypothetical protein n=1 Tax=Carnobacterium gallinarum TaxID=2749 RepID=UPI00054E8F0E|nr:hypothetical protein [Carnobacterium gallinarum]
MVKKFLVIIVSVSILIVSFLPQAFAASASVWVQWQTYASGNGRSNGKTNGKFYYLNSGRTARLNISSKSGPGTAQVTLYRNTWAVDKSFGTVSATTGSKNFPTKTDQTGSNYYLLFFSGKSNTTQTVSGTLSD